jgi:hypothetical protein
MTTNIKEDDPRETKISFFEGHPHFIEKPVCFFHGTKYGDKYILLSEDAIAKEMIYML